MLSKDDPEEPKIIKKKKVSNNTRVQNALFLLSNTGKSCLSTLVFLCIRDTVLLQTEGLWQPHVKQVYWYHFLNSIISTISKLRHVYVYRASSCGTLSRLPENVNITFICTGKPESLCDSFYCSIFVMIWNWGCGISKVCLYFFK